MQPTNTQRAAALLSPPDTLLDHLGVLASILKIPLIVSQQESYDLAKTFYPQVDVFIVEKQDLTLPYLASHFDLLFVSSKLWAIELFPLFPLFQQKNMRIIYCPHGNSDKGHTLKENDHAPEDVSLVYGDHMLDLLKDTQMYKRINQVILTGNYRYPFFIQNKSFYQTLTNNRIFSKLDKTKKTCFYAPTWSNDENPSSFPTECSRLIDQITPSFNLLIKLHPYLYEKNCAQTHLIYEKYKDHPQVLFLNDFPPIYPLLDLADIYLGDFSSIGYDFLSFNKPMYFFNSSDSTDRGTFLHQCGMTLSAKHTNIFDFIEKTHEQNRTQFSEIRQKTYRYTFGPKKNLPTIRKTILDSLQ
jgi:CDP-glycerol glycerophosphotransferase (TagB/SpsB family)